MIEGQEWSPAHNPYAIAFSQAQWAWWSLNLFVRQARASGGTDQQIYARQIPKHLRDLRLAALMQQKAISDEADQQAQEALQAALARFDTAVPAAKGMRDMAEHFDKYACGEGNLQKRVIAAEGIDRIEVARRFWGGGYDPSSDTLNEGPFAIVVATALDEARELYWAVYFAGKAVDHARDGEQLTHELEQATQREPAPAQRPPEAPA